MRVHVSDARLLRNLILFLRKCGCVAEQASASELEAYLPDTPHKQAARMELRVYLDAWAARQDAGVRAEIIS